MSHLCKRAKRAKGATVVRVDYRIEQRVNIINGDSNFFHLSETGIIF